ncbi:MAG: anaerobic glycerol-3-phosphate dehydrogenase subunit GlpC [Thermodesulfobacteriota bacterium]
MIDLDNTSFDRCIKCTVCTAYCPVARVTPLYPGPKYSGPDAERMRIKTPFLADGSLAYCNNCKRCETVCPSGVRITDFISLARSDRLKKRHRIRDFLLAHTDLAGFFATRLSGMANAVLNLKVVKTALRLFLNISSAIRFPAYAKGSFAKQLAAESDIQKKFPEQVLYFYGCYVNYNFHGLGRDVVAVLNAMNVGVTAPPQKCCGVPLIAAGNLARAKKNAADNIRSLTDAVKKRDRKIVFSSSSCILTVQHDYPELLDMDTSTIDDRIEFITRFIYKKFKAGGAPPMKPLDITAAYHSPCHLERTGGVMYTIGMLRRIPGLRLVLLHSECCGLAGTYGFKKEFETIARDIGLPLFRQIQAAAPDVVITDCEACKWQIEANTGIRVLHPVSVLAMALKPS